MKNFVSLFLLFMSVTLSANASSQSSPPPLEVHHPHRLLLDLFNTVRYPPPTPLVGYLSAPTSKKYVHRHLLIQALYLKKKQQREKIIGLLRQKGFSQK